MLIQSVQLKKFQVGIFLQCNRVYKLIDVFYEPFSKNVLFYS